MTYEETLDALSQLEGRAVEIDFVVVRAGPGTQPGLDRDDRPGVLRRKAPWEVAEFWWTLPEAAHYELIPDGGLMVRRDRFKGARWDGYSLDIDMGSYRQRIVQLGRRGS